MTLRLATISALCLLILGCGRTPETLAPPAVHWGRDTCESCGMILSDPRYAGAVVLRRQPGGAEENHLFDDLGEMLAWNPPAAAEIRWYVGDRQTGEWIDATTANFVHDADFHTPMYGGFAAFATAEAARAARPHATDQVLDFTSARQAALVKR